MLFIRNDAKVIPGLDGLRAISILCVIVAHLLWVPSFPFKVISRFMNPADLGVRTFFVISGFLITTLLLREKDRSGTISLGNFYCRRTLRIFPAYYAFLACTFLLASFRVIQLERADYFLTMTYTFNFKPALFGSNTTWWVGHTWSLAIEEQYYFLWPLVVRKCSVRTLKRVLILFACAAAVGRAIPWVEKWQALPTVGDPIAIGALLAVVFHDKVRKARLESFVGRWWFWAVPSLVVAIEALDHRSRFFPHPIILNSVLRPLVVNTGLAFVVARAALVTKDAFGRFLNSQIMAAIGLLSYSLYLWHMLFLNPVSTRAALRFPLDLLWAAAAAILSFVLIERPLNDLRRKRGRALLAPQIQLSSMLPEA
jgi:peptidoglycan/LPS O-acetylase OafA/YrhL